MILIDANLLIYAHVRDMPQHNAAHEWLDRSLTEMPRVGLAWSSLLAFVRLTSNPRIFDRPLTIAEAWKQAESWLAAPTAWIPLPTDRHQTILGDLLTARSGLRSNVVPDAHLAALAIGHGLTLCSADRDFSNFPKLRWENPLA